MSWEWMAWVSSAPPNSVSKRPRHGIVFGAAQPGGLDGREIRLAGEAKFDNAPRLLEAVAETILEHRHDAPARPGLGGGELVDLVQRADKRFFADHLLAGGERCHDLRKVQRWRRADIDDVDVIHGQHLVERSGPARHRELIADGGEALLVEVADHL